MSQREIRVEAQRTFVTPRGRKFVPREPKRFEVTLEKDGDPFTSLRDKVTSQFPRLQGQYQLFYKDTEGKLHPFGDHTMMQGALATMKHDTLAIYIQGESPQGKCQAQQPGTATQCSSCNGDIVGVRTKCLQCENFNLCGQCESHGLHVHHVMVRCDRPRFFNLGLPKFTDVIPALCEQQKQNATDPGNLPRLDAQKVRQFWMSQKKLQKAGGRNKTNQGQGESRQCQMKDMWRQFLLGISAEGQHKGESQKGGQQIWQQKGGHQKRWMKMKQTCDDDKAQQSDSWEHVSMDTESPKPSSINALKTDDESTTSPVEKPKLQQLKRQWMQKCRQAWREQMQNAAEKRSQKDGDKHRFFGLWRPYMRQCFDQWQQLTKKEGHDIPAQQIKPYNTDKEGGQRGGHCDARRQWIQACWQLWREEAGKITPLDPEDRTSQAGSGAYQEQSSGYRGPFPGYHNMMNRSWRQLMNLKVTAKNEHGAVISQQEGEQKESQEETARKPTQLGPKMAKQILKQTWKTGCRELWWRLVSITAVNHTPDKAEINDLSQLDIMKTMADKQKIRVYLMECWKLWIQLSRQAGLPVKLNTKDTEAEHPSEEPSKPKQLWMQNVLPLWMEAVTKQTETGSDSGKPMWEKRPFQGWRQLIMKSWEKIEECIQDQICGKQQLTKEVRQECVQSMTKAYEQYIGKKMGKMSLDDKLSEAMDIEKKPPKNNAKLVLTAEEHNQLKQKLMKQYWSVWEQHQQSQDWPRHKLDRHPGQKWKKIHEERKKCEMNQLQENCENQMECDSECHEETLNTSPRLKITLSMKSNPVTHK